VWAIKLQFRLCIEGETKLKINTRLSRWRDYHVPFFSKTFYRFPNFIKVEKSYTNSYNLHTNSQPIFKQPRVGFNLLFHADLPVGIDLGQPPKNALHSWCFFFIVAQQPIADIDIIVPTTKNPNHYY
jgi:hypothetical protein